jgi:Zn-dependent protease with chaperone function
MAASDQRIRDKLKALEAEARDHPRWHAARLITLACFGYLFPLLLLSVSFGFVLTLVAATIAGGASTSDGLIVVGVILLCGSVLTIAAILRTFWIAMPPPDGHLLPDDQAPDLRRLIEEVRVSLKGPRIHRIYFDPSFNAGVLQRRRFGIWGPRVNSLLLGLPMLMALSPDQLRIVLAHEFGHLARSDSTFGSWFYRMNSTWDLLAAPGRWKRMRWLTAGWFVTWFGKYFSISTLAVRRIHEYRADRSAANVFGKSDVADVLMRISWLGYRLNQQFWPATIRRAATTPLPPTDALAQMADLFSAPPPAALYERWSYRETTARTPITSVHPCLADRLAALGKKNLRESASSRITAAPKVAAASLLGDCRPQIQILVNSLWKAEVIHHWRRTYATAQYFEKESSQRVDLPADAPAGEGEWQPLSLVIDRADDEQAQSMLAEFTQRYPDHPEAAFSLGRLLLGSDDPRAPDVLEKSIRLSSRNIGPALHLLLDYHREAGRDEQADIYRVRLEQHQQISEKARVERAKVARGDRFAPHGLPARDVERLRRFFIQFPRIRRVYMVRKQVRLLSDQASYVMLVERRSTLLDDRRVDKLLIASVAENVPFPCATVMSRRLPRAVRGRILSVAGEPIFAAD